MFDVEVENLTKRFGDFTAVDALNFSVEHGEVFGLLGPNGAGKSTLIRMLTTLVPPTSGTARVNGFDIVRAANDVRQSIGVIPQAMTSDLDLSAVENMSIFAKLYGIPREKRLRTIKQLLQEVDLEKWGDKPVKMFAGWKSPGAWCMNRSFFSSMSRPPVLTPCRASPFGKCSRDSNASGT
jgi:ABC-2 type transport system ATP-binding protein